MPKGIDDRRKRNRQIANLIRSQGIEVPPEYELRGEILADVQKDAKLERAADVAIRFACQLIQSTWSEQEEQSRRNSTYRTRYAAPCSYTVQKAPRSRTPDYEDQGAGVFFNPTD